MSIFECDKVRPLDEKAFRLEEQIVAARAPGDWQIFTTGRKFDRSGRVLALKQYAVA